MEVPNDTDQTLWIDEYPPGRSGTSGDRTTGLSRTSRSRLRRANALASAKPLSLLTHTDERKSKRRGPAGRYG